jgi:fructan beta-fructosidase
MKRSLIFTLVFILTGSVFAQDSPTSTEQWRPLYHFTPLKNWTNDPNGLIYLNGIYHMYNQQNPFENKWGHMSWGHSTSTDLLHWEHLPIAIPERIDKDTTWIFSGCAVWDKDNTSGFCKDGGCLVAIYTADQPNLKKESQFISYSNDGGATFTNYDKNPVIDLNKKDFRDPNVFWYDPGKQWVMVVALPNEHTVRFYNSTDLKKWNLSGEFGQQGYTQAWWECPFMIQLDVTGTPGLKKWVLVNSAGGPKRGSFMQYYVGDFDGKTFKNDNPPYKELTVDYGDCLYAAIPWNNLPENKKIFIGWMTPGPQSTYPWKGQMSIPRDLSLGKTEHGIRLLQQPSSIIKNELASLPADRKIEMKNVEVSNRELSMGDRITLSANSYWIDAEWSIKSGKNVGFKIAQLKDKRNKTIAETIVGYDVTKHQIYVDRSHSGKGKINENKSRQIIELENENDKINLQILVDKSSLEVFVNNGEKVLTTHIYPDEGADQLAAFSFGGKAMISSLTIWDLSK